MDIKNYSDEDKEKQIHVLSKEFRSGNLSLVCGAGVSIGAQVPSWNTLLIQLLSVVIQKFTTEASITEDVTPDDFHDLYSRSSLMLGNYLKNNLGSSFKEEVRNALYSSNPTTCEMLKAIAKLAKPQRNIKSLDSIITFNFDSLIEETLEQSNIDFQPIYAEGMRHHSNELPIYHVHGYLPRVGEIEPEREIVFSEDAYHSHFLDPFSWANLVQLNKLTRKTCLLVGLSMKDPNLRRLLDVASRKNPSKNLNHYIIKPIPQNEKPTVAQLAMLLEEQDANSLGLKVIWIEDFDEIPLLLNHIYEKAVFNR